jgi:DNA polymerase-3 subunit gamma/tau
MVGQEHVLRALANALDTGRIHHAFLFTGTRGVGKTTLARIFAKSLNCEKGISSSPCGECSTCQEIDAGRFVDLIEVDAASRTKVEDTRELLDNVQYAPSRGRYKVYLVDEVHMLSNHSFNALLKTLEEPPEHVKFLLATTDPQKLPVTILSRCLQFNLRRLHHDLISKYLAKLLTSEQLEFEEAALQHLARAADGSMRDALSLLDQAIAYGSGKVLDSDVKQMLGTIEQTHLYRILTALADRNSEALYEVLSELKTTTPNYPDVIASLLSMLHYVALLQQIPSAYDPSMGDETALRDLASRLSPEDVQLFYQIGIHGQRDLNFAPEPSMGVEMTLLRMLAFKPDTGEGLTATMPNQSGKTRPVVETVVQDTAAQVVKPEITDSTPVINPAELSGWSEIVAELKLNGLLNQLAMNCSLMEKKDDRFVLALDPTFENLLTRERQDRLKEALSDFYNKEIQLEIGVQQAEKETPAMQEKREEQAKFDAAQQAIEADANVKKILDTFQAQIKTDTIQPK